MQRDSAASLQRELKANAAKSTKSSHSLSTSIQSNDNLRRITHLYTVGDGNCFFYAVFGDVNSSGEYETDNAQAMRQEWHKFLSGFESPKSESMPNKLKKLYR